MWGLQQKVQHHQKALHRGHTAMFVQSKPSSYKVTEKISTTMWKVKLQKQKSAKLPHANNKNEKYLPSALSHITHYYIQVI